MVVMVVLEQLLQFLVLQVQEQVEVEEELAHQDCSGKLVAGGAGGGGGGGKGSSTEWY
jgi:hypothetical protein